ncbi:MAG: nitronate monooxygenase [Gammaproteobacteria bacterium]|nr:nitronate monooxygenase [Gammaproteobacteria bacterium]
MIATRFTERFGLAQPIALAPMAHVAGTELASAVSNAGALGLVGGGYAGTQGPERRAADELARCPPERCGIGFITWALALDPTQLARALALRPACVFLSFGDPRPFAAEIHAAGVPLVCQIQNLVQLEAALAAGAAVVVAQGTEAGGHGARRATLPLVPEVADRLRERAPDTLLLAAGGIADGRGLAAALLLGADGAVIGTRFWAAREALTADAAIARGLAASGDETVRTAAIDALRGVPWPAEYSFRVLRNDLTAAWAGREAEAERQRGTLAAAYRAARERDDYAVAAAVAGEAIGLCSERESAATLVARIGAEAADLLRRGATLDFRKR